MTENGRLGEANLLRPGLHANLAQLRPVAQAPGIRTTSTKRFAWSGAAANDLLLFEGFHILNAVDHPAPDLDVAGTDPEITPTLERLVADLPPVGEMILVQMSTRLRSLAITSLLFEKNVNAGG